MFNLDACQRMDRARGQRRWASIQAEIELLRKRQTEIAGRAREDDDVAAEHDALGDAIGELMREASELPREEPMR